MDQTEALPPDLAGTKVYTDVLEVSSDSLFPLQGALGYELSQTLFVGPNSLIVEGVSDLLYLQVISDLLQRMGRTSLSVDWTITPVGGSDKVPAVVAMLGAQKGMTVATLIDVQEKDRQRIDNLYKRKLLQKNNVLTFADFTGTREADIEDMFEVDFYLRLVTEEYGKALTQPLKSPDLAHEHPRILVRLEKHLGAYPLRDDSFNHFRPARYYSENTATLNDAVGDLTLSRFETAFRALNKILAK